MFKVPYECGCWTTGAAERMKYDPGSLVLATFLCFEGSSDAIALHCASCHYNARF